jgi:DNA topoisomerase I
MSKPIPPDEPSSAPTPAADDMLADLGLRYMSDAVPGITRRRVGKSFSYRAPDGRVLPNDGTKEWIRSLAIPPAWQHVWISPRRDGHLLATGRDARGRKQYRYHPRWRSLRDEAKFGRMLAFAQALPRIRDGVEAELRKPGLGRRKVLATVVRLLETTLIRVGNDEYARSNRTFGLTTLRNRHVKAEGSELRFTFRGKSGKRHAVTLKNRRLVNLIAKMRELPGQELFQYLDEDGVPQPIDSADVNAFLREIAGDEFTAKDFRTWAGTVLAAWALREFTAFDSEAAAKRNVTQAIERVASRLGNTPAICRKSYVHPEIVGAYLDGSLLASLRLEIETELREELAGLQPEEVAVLMFLQQRLSRTEKLP